MTKEEIEQNINLIKISPNLISSVEDCVTEKNPLTGEVVGIHISGYDYLSLLPSLAHEFTHSIFEAKDFDEYIKYLCNYHYKEFPSIVTEKIIAKEAEEKTNLPFLLGMEHLRVKHLKLILEIEQNTKAIKDTSEFFKYVSIFQTHDTYSYLLGDILATTIFEKYLNDPKKVKEKHKSLLHRELTIEEYLEYFKVSMKDFQTIENYQKKMNKITK
jgi:hypothetical protein